MATVQQLVTAVTSLAAAFQPLPDAINALEAAITAAKNSGALSPADQAAVDQAMQTVQGLTAGVTAAVADATDGVDEAASPTGPT